MVTVVSGNLHMVTLAGPATGGLEPGVFPSPRARLCGRRLRLGWEARSRGRGGGGGDDGAGGTGTAQGQRDLLSIAHACALRGPWACRDPRPGAGGGAWAWMPAPPLTAAATLGISGNPARWAWGSVSVALRCRPGPLEAGWGAAGAAAFHITPTVIKETRGPQ